MSSRRYFIVVPPGVSEPTRYRSKDGEDRYLIYGLRRSAERMATYLRRHENFDCVVVSWLGVHPITEHNAVVGRLRRTSGDVDRRRYEKR